jgi:hypothetical protein
MKKALVLFFLVILSQAVVAESIAMSPASHELGDISRGSSERVEVYVDAIGYDEPFSIEPSYQKPRISAIMNEDRTVKSSYSHQDIASWIEFSQDTYRIDPEGKVNFSGKTYDGRITYTVDVPSSDAEPGIHGGVITPQIVDEGEGSGFSASSLGLAVYQFQFRVPGTAYTQLEYNPRVIRTGPEEITVVNRIVNQGTVSTVANEARFTLANANETFSTSRTINSIFVPAGGRETVVKVIDSSQVSAGNYQIEGNVNFMTGSATASESFSLSDIVDVEPGELENDSSGPTGSFDNDSLPFWLVVMVLVMVGVLMYSFNIDPIWIIMAVGVLGISMFVIFSPVPNYILAVLLTATGLLVYYGLM